MYIYYIYIYIYLYIYIYIYIYIYSHVSFIFSLVFSNTPYYTLYKTAPTQNLWIAKQLDYLRLDKRDMNVHVYILMTVQVLYL